MKRNPQVLAASFRPACAAIPMSLEGHLAKTRGAFSRGRGPNSISPTDAILTATRSARCTGWVEYRLLGPGPRLVGLGQAQASDNVSRPVAAHDLRGLGLEAAFDLRDLVGALRFGL